MKKLYKIWNIWDSTSGRVVSIVGSLGLLVGGLAILVSAVSTMFSDPTVNCLRDDLTHNEFQICSIDERHKSGRETLFKKWTGRQVTWKGTFEQIVPGGKSSTGIHIEDNDGSRNYVVSTFVSPPGRGNILWCEAVFQRIAMATSYLNLIKQFKEGQSVTMSGTIKLAKSRGNMVVSDCVLSIFEER